MVDAKVYYAALLVIMGLTSTWCGPGVNWPILSEILGFCRVFFWDTFVGTLGIMLKAFEKDYIGNIILIESYIHMLKSHTCSNPGFFVGRSSKFVSLGSLILNLEVVLWLGLLPWRVLSQHVLAMQLWVSSRRRRLASIWPIKGKLDRRNIMQKLLGRQELS